MSAAVQLAKPMEISIRALDPELDTRKIQATWMDSMIPSRCRDVPRKYVRVRDQRCIEFNGHTYVRNDFASQLSLGKRDDLLDLSRQHWARARALLIDDFLARASFAIACLPETPDRLAGWACYEGPELHFVYVERVARRNYIARQLVAHTGCSTASIVTQLGRPLLRYLDGEAA